MEKSNDYLIKDISEADIQNSIEQATENTVPKDVLNVSDDMLDKYYEIGRELLEGHHFEDAVGVYTFLTFLTPLYSNFWLGLGIAQQSLENYEEAITSYMMSISADPNNIAPYVNCAQCNIACGEKEAAHKLCDIALELSSDESEKKQINEIKNNI